MNKNNTMVFAVIIISLALIQLSEKRRVTIQDFRGKTLVSIREYYKKDGKELPTSKGAF